MQVSKIRYGVGIRYANTNGQIIYRRGKFARTNMLHMEQLAIVSRQEKKTLRRSRKLLIINPSVLSVVLGRVLTA